MSLKKKEEYRSPKGMWETHLNRITSLTLKRSPAQLGNPSIPLPCGTFSPLPLRPGTKGPAALPPALQTWHALSTFLTAPLLISTQVLLPSSLSWHRVPEGHWKFWHSVVPPMQTQLWVQLLESQLLPSCRSHVKGSIVRGREGCFWRDNLPSCRGTYICPVFLQVSPLLKSTDHRRKKIISEAGGGFRKELLCAVGPHQVSGDTVQR